MDFIIGIPKLKYHHDSIFMMVDKLTKVPQFIVGNTIDDAVIITKKIIKEIC